MRTWSSPWRCGPTAHSSPRPRSTRRCGSGTWAGPARRRLPRSFRFRLRRRLYARRPRALHRRQGPDDQADQRPHTEGRAHLQRPQRRGPRRGGSSRRQAIRLGRRRAADSLVDARRRQAAGAARRALRPGPSARLQRRRPAADLRGRRRLGPALGRHDRASRSGSSPGQPSGNTRPPSRTTGGWPPRAAGTAWSGSGMPTPAACCATLVQPPDRVRQPELERAAGSRMAGGHARWATSPARAA